MINKKNILFIPIAILLLITIAIPNSNMFAKEKTYNEKHLITELKKEKIYLYYDKKTDAGTFSGFYLKSGKKVKYFNWNNINKPGFEPSIHILKDKYIAIICTEEEGTGIAQRNLYILDRNTLKLCNYKNPLDIIKSNVTSDIKDNKVTIKIKNNTFNSIYPDIESTHFYDDIGYGSIINYDIQNTYFTVTIPVQITPALFIGDFKITYRWDEKKSTFIPYDINFNFDNTLLN